MADAQDTYVALPDGSYVQVPHDATPNQLSALRQKLGGQQPLDITNPEQMTARGPAAKAPLPESNIPKMTGLGALEKMRPVVPGQLVPPAQTEKEALQDVGMLGTGATLATTAPSMAGGATLGLTGYMADKAIHAQRPTLVGAATATGIGAVGGPILKYGGKMLGPLASRVLRDSEGEISVSPSKVLDRIVPQRPEILAKEAKEAEEAAMEERAEALMRRGKEQEVLDKTHESQLTAAEQARQKELADAERLREQDAHALMRRGKEQDVLDKAHESQLTATEQARQKELADAERFREQHAHALNAREEPPPPRMKPFGDVMLPERQAAIPQGGRTPFQEFSERQAIANREDAEQVGPWGEEGRPATWTNERVVQLAKQGNRDAIEQANLRGIKIPYVSEGVLPYKTKPLGSIMLTGIK